MTKLAAITLAAGEHHLAVLGILPVLPEDNLPGMASLLLLGPKEPGFWAHVTSAPEFSDGAPDPLDRWSRRVIGRLACDYGGKARFPFGGPPYSPFFQWALRSGQSYASPVHLLVNDRAGLMVSFRGAIALRDKIATEPARSPCPNCVAPCAAACPAGALTPAHYDVPACRAWVQSEAGRDCREGGCLVRRACPISVGYGRVAAQSAYHMSRFLKDPPAS